jgi:hypothetical protein
MVIELEPIPFHYVIKTFYGSKKQGFKIIEELQELSEALDSGDRDSIVEELSDVEVVLPYLKITYVPNAVLKIRSSADMDFGLLSDVFIRLLKFRIASDCSPEIHQSLSLLSSALCYSLYPIYIKYKIKREEVEAIKEFKKKRTLMNLYKKEKANV